MAKQRLKSPRARLFVALDLPEKIRDGIVGWQRRELTDPALRVLKPQALHVTLAFLGYHPERRIEEIAERALPPGTKAPELRLQADPVTRGSPPRLYALEAESEETIAIQAEVSDRLEGAGFYEPEKRPFWPHITVARMRREKRGSQRPARVEKPPGPLPEDLLEPFGGVRIALYRSHLRQSGAEYESVSAIELSR